MAFSSHGRELSVSGCALSEDPELTKLGIVVPAPAEDLVSGVLREDSGVEDSFVLVSHGRDSGVAVCSLSDDPDLTSLCMVPEEDLVPDGLREDSGVEDSFVLVSHGRDSGVAVCSLSKDPGLTPLCVIT